MRLYVHVEDAQTTWTKRMSIAPSTTAIRDLFAVFAAAYQKKFARDLGESEWHVFMERNQDPSTRRLIPPSKHEQTLVQVLGAAACDGSGGAGGKEPCCAVELVMVRNSAQPHPAPPPPPAAVDPSLTATAPVSPSADVSAPHVLNVASAAISSSAGASVVVTPPLPEDTKMAKLQGDADTKKTGADSVRVAPDGDASAEDASLHGILELAASHMLRRNYRSARDLYQTLVLSVEPTHAEALLSMGQIYASNAKYALAIKKCFRKCWESHHERPLDKCHAEMVFQSGLKMAECQIQLQKLRPALATIEGLQQFLKKHAKPKNRGFFSDPNEKEKMEAKIDYLRAWALYDLNTPVEQDTAIGLVMHLLPDLQDANVNLDALQLYARIAQDRGKTAEALSMMLRVLVGKSADKGVRKQLVALLQGKNAIDRLAVAVPLTTPSSAAAYAFMATILKDFGVMETSIKCFEQALTKNPSNPSYALNIAHSWEVCHQYLAAYEALMSFLRMNASLTVAGLISVKQVLDALQKSGWDTPVDGTTIAHEMKQWELGWEGECSNGFANVKQNGVRIGKPIVVGPVAKATLSESDLDLLACFFTLVKILYLNGRFPALPRLIALIEPARYQRDLHQTTIRNEQAYYTCIVQLMCAPSPPLDYAWSDHAKQVTRATYVCGDSHTLATAWRQIPVGEATVPLVPALVTGLKHWHLRKDSTFYPKVNFWHTLETIPNGARVILLFGEIDCREGILVAVERCRYEDIEEGMEHTASIFMEAVAHVVERFHFDVLIHPIVPVLNETRSMVLQYNKILQAHVNKSRVCRWLDFADDLIEGSPPMLRKQYELDGTHLHPSYLHLLGRELAKIPAPSK